MDTHISQHSFEQSLAEAQSGSLTAIGRLLNQFRSQLLLIGDEDHQPQYRDRPAPSDVVQLTQLEAHRNFDRVRDRMSDEFRGRLRRILIQNLADARRTAKKSSADGFAETIDFPDSGDTDRTSGSIAAAEERVGPFALLLEALPAHSRQVIRLRHVERRDFAAIGQEMGCSAEAARKLWIRALRNLQSETRRPT